MKKLLAVAVAASVLGFPACARGPGVATPAGGPQPANDRVLVNVTNYYGLPIVVSAVGSGTVYRMGTAYPGMVSQFALRQAMLASGGMVEFVAQPAGTERPVRSGRLLLTPGDVVDFEIATHLLGSYAAVRL
jgi:hypothetical protein